MKNTFNKYIQAANSEDMRNIVDMLREQALKDCPNMTAEQWQLLKCFMLSGAIAKIENNDKNNRFAVSYKPQIKF